MRGERLEDGSYSGTIPLVLDVGGFSAKALVIGGACDEEESAPMGGKFLGLEYLPEKDQIVMRLTTKICKGQDSPKSKRKSH